MLIGEHRHSLDAKKRVAIPASFRSLLGKKVVLTRGLDNCLFIYPLKQWQQVLEKLAKLPLGRADTRSFHRFMLAGAVEQEVDGLGRILIPDFLKEFAGLKSKVVIAGIHERLEVWDEKRWKEQTTRIEKQADVLAEKLGEIGIL